VLVFGLGWGTSGGLQHVFHWLHQYFVRRRQSWPYST
jgi:hypothetical protein